MTEGPRIGLALLAAGSSRRFGGADKLAASYRGFMLGLHTANLAPVHLFKRAWVIASETGHPCELGWRAYGFEIVVNPQHRSGMGTSVALAARLARQIELDALVVALADMPEVPGKHIEALIAALADPNDIVASGREGTTMPPAIFGSAHFDTLATLSGDVGARPLLSNARVIECPPGWLADIDTPEDLADFE